MLQSRPTALKFLVLLSFLAVGCSRDVPETKTSPPAPQVDPIAAAEEQVKKQNTPEAYLNLSLVYYNAQDFQLCIDAAKTALQMRPSYAEAFNNIAAAQIMLGDYDAAITNATQAVRISPETQLYKNNLARAQREKAAKKEQAAKSATK